MNDITEADRASREEGVVHTLRILGIPEDAISRAVEREDPEELEALCRARAPALGIGPLPMEEVEPRLSAVCVGFIGLAVIAGNEDALRFYERWGMAPSHVRCLGGRSRPEAIASPRAGPGRSGDGLEPGRVPP